MTQSHMARRPPNKQLDRTVEAPARVGASPAGQLRRYTDDENELWVAGVPSSIWLKVAGSPALAAPAAAEHRNFFEGLSLFAAGR
jgi:hypothetical protein